MTMPSIASLDEAADTLLGSAAIEGNAVVGFVLLSARPDERLVVELIADGVALQVARADLYSARLAATGIADAFHGFAFDVPSDLLATLGWFEVRLANGGPSVGATLDVARDMRPALQAPGSGHVAWLGGLRFDGWTAPTEHATFDVRALIDEVHVADARRTGWTMARVGAAEIAVSGFEANLPQRFADGRVHRVEFLTADGVVLPPGSLSFVAFEDGLRRFLADRSDLASEQLRGDLFDRLIPQSMPFDLFEPWQARFGRQPVAREQGDLGPTVAVVLIGEVGLEASLESLQGQRIGWTAGVLPNRDHAYDFHPQDLVDFLEGDGLDSDVIVFAPAGSVLFDGALETLAEALLSRGGATSPGDATVAFCDVVAEAHDGARVPLAFGAFDRERMIAQGYAGWLFAMRREAALTFAQAGARSPFHLVNAAMTSMVPRHVPGFLGRVPPVDPAVVTSALIEAAKEYFERSGRDLRIEPSARAGARGGIRATGVHSRCLVSVVVSVRDDVEALDRCLGGLKRQETAHEIEIVLVETGASGPAMRLHLRGLAEAGLTVVRSSSATNAARACNKGADVARGDYLCFIDQAVVLSSDDALDEMVGRCVDETVAAVGGLLTWPSGAVLDGGLVVNYRDGAAKAFTGASEMEAGYAGLLGVARECVAVSGVFLLVRRHAFVSKGGMNEVEFPLFFSAVDYCLRRRAAGERVVFTPHAVASVSAPLEPPLSSAERAARLARELTALRAHWADMIVADAFYGPLLNLDGPLHSALAWPPRPMGASGPPLVLIDTPAALPAQVPISKPNEEPQG